jgi:ATP-dependent helicase/nuclease subunit B
MVRVFTSSSAAERTSAASQFVNSFPEGTEILMVGASREAADDLARAECSARQATFGLHRSSLIQLAARLAIPTLAKLGVAPSSSLGMDAIIVRTVFEALQADRLGYFAPVARCPGFGRASSSTLTQLRAAGAIGADLEALPDPGPDNAFLLKALEEQLTAASVVDKAKLLRTAAEVVAESTWLSKIPILILDVPVHSVVEKMFITSLAGRSPAMFITCPSGDTITADSLSKLPNVEVLKPEPVNSTSSLSRLAHYLFSEAEPAKSTADDQVVFFSAPGEERECVEIVRKVLDDARSGTRFNQIAVLLRAPQNYSSLIETAFRRAAVPLLFAQGIRRPDPSGRALLSLLAFAEEGLSARRFAEFLSFGQLPQIGTTGSPLVHIIKDAVPEDESLGVPASVQIRDPEAARDDGTEATDDTDDKPALGGSLRAPWKWERLLVEAAVIGGKDRWERRLSGLENKFRMHVEAQRKEDPWSSRIAGLERDLENLAHLKTFALPIIDELTALPKSATWGEWTAALQELVPKVLSNPERVLSILADLNPMGPVGPVSLAEIRRVLHERLSNVEQEKPAYRYGRVFVGTPEQARGRSFEAVFVPGLAEKMFPQKLREDPLLLDDLRTQLSPDLAVQADRAQLERLLLHISVGSARRRLYLSFPRVDIAEARPRVPSFYALDIMRSITGSVPDIEELNRTAEKTTQSRLSWPAPLHAEDAIDDSEYHLAILDPLLSKSSVERNGRFAYAMKLNDHLARSLRTRWARWDKQWRPQDGLCFKTEGVVEVLKEFRLTARPYSVSALQRFSRCPYEFLLASIHRLEPREEPDAFHQMDPLTRGHITHHIQADVLRNLQKARSLPVSKENLDAALATLDNTIDTVSKSYFEELAPAILSVWDDAIAIIRADLRGWLLKMSTEDSWTPINFEFGFGFRPGGDRDPQSDPNPVTLSTGHMLHGIVDLIEQSRHDNSLRITDHKTGVDRNKAGVIVGGGATLQPVLYGLAIETSMGRPVIAGRLSYCTVQERFNERTVALNDVARESAREILTTIDSAIEDVLLNPSPSEGSCTRCDFKNVCGPYEEIRISQKSDQSSQERLFRIRKLP